MKTGKEIHLDFIVDRLTNSIQNTISGDSFPTEVGAYHFSGHRMIIPTNAQKC